MDTSHYTDVETDELPMGIDPMGSVDQEWLHGFVVGSFRDGDWVAYDTPAEWDSYLLGVGAGLDAPEGTYPVEAWSPDPQGGSRF